MSELSAAKDRFEAAIAEYVEAVELGNTVDRAAFLARHQDLASQLSEFFENYDRLGRKALQRKKRDDLEATVASDHSQTVPGVGARLQYFGDYELLDELARGGMGVVYKARQVSVNRTVALKMILAGQLASKVDMQRFRTEAETAANLDHPNIVPIYEVGEHAGQQYYTMKLIEGSSLGEERSSYKERHEDAARLVAEVARAVHYAHQRGVLHRDLKPANILLDHDGRPHITDFGLAKRLEADAELTQSGAIMGTPQYMAPEQASGRRGAVTTLADVYSLGVILYELVAGKAPFSGDSVMEVLDQVRLGEPEPPSKFDPGIDRDLEAVCMKCLAKSPADRYPSALAFAEDLEHWLAKEPIVARPPSLAQLMWVWLRKNVGAALWTVGVGTILGGLGSIFFSLLSIWELLIRVNETYLRFPSLDPPWLAVSWDPGGKALLVCMVVGSLMLASMGLITVLYVRPKDRWGDLVAGATTGIASGISSFVFGIGWATLLSTTVVASFPDYFVFADAIDSRKLAKATPSGAPLVHGSEILIAKYPDLKQFDPDDRGQFLAPKIVADQVGGTLAGIWLGMAVSLFCVGGAAVIQSLFAGALLRRRQRVLRAIIPYFELTFPACVLLFFALVVVVSLVRGGNGDFEAFAPALDAILLLLALASIGVFYEWRWHVRWACYLTVFIMFAAQMVLHWPLWRYFGNIALCWLPAALFIGLSALRESNRREIAQEASNA